MIKAREAFDQLSKLGNGDCDGNSIGNSIAQEARTNSSVISMKTLDKVLKLKAKISKLVNEIVAIQDSCPHDNVVKIARSDTGNYCKADDSYWYDCKCHDCLHTWTEDQ